MISIAGNDVTYGLLSMALGLLAWLALGIRRRRPTPESDLAPHLQHQPQPVRKAGKPDIWSLVIADMHARNEFGRRKYGGPLQPFDGRDNLADIYQELIDSCVYIRKELYRRDGK